jgi:hypothetical protein
MIVEGWWYLQSRDDGLGVVRGASLAAQIARQSLAFRQGIKSSLLDSVRVIVQAHVSQHHHGAEKQSSGVGLALTSDIRSRTVDSLENGALVTNVAGGGKTETTNQTSAHVGQNVTVQVGHDQDLVVVGQRVGNHLQAGVVEQLSIELDVGEVLGNILGDVQEETIRHLHDGGLVDDADLLAADLGGVLESESQNTLAGLAGDELDALDDTINHDMLDSGVFTLGVLADENGVNAVVGGLVAGNRPARSQVGEEVECSSQGEVEGNMALADRSGEGALEGNLVPLNALNCRRGDAGLAIDKHRCDVNGLPRDRCLGSGEDVLHSLRDLRTNTVSLDDRDREVSAGILLSGELGHLVRVESSVLER